MSPLQPVLASVLGALLWLVASATNAEVTILESHMTLLNVVTSVGTELVESAAAARAIGAGTTGPGTIVGVFPSGLIGPPLPSPPPNPRGFSVVNPATDPVPLRVPARMLPIGRLGWLEPYDVNSAGIFVGQARASSGSAVRYAFGNSAPDVPLAPGLNDPNMWAGSAATAVNNRNVVVGWKKPTNGGEQAFYWTSGGGLQDIIPVNGARNSRALSISDSGLVAGYYEPQAGSGGERNGFVFDIVSRTFTDFGPVVVEPSAWWFEEFRNVSINNDGRVAATREVGSGSDQANQAFLLDGRSRTTTPIEPTGDFEDTFAAGISDTSWVVGILRDQQGSETDSGFLWVGGKTFDLSQLTLPAGWTRITAVYDAYSTPDSSDPLGLRQIGTIVGMGLFKESVNADPTARAFAMQITLQVPEPQTYLMLGVGVLALGALRMRRPTAR